jgi:branched-subunit amino acid aminotransferase/4-amino-4-deoxychorismate lyase
MILTPGTDAGIVEGITRGVVLEIARQKGLQVVEDDSTPLKSDVPQKCF